MRPMITAIAAVLLAGSLAACSRGPGQQGPSYYEGNAQFGASRSVVTTRRIEHPFTNVPRSKQYPCYRDASGQNHRVGKNDPRRKGLCFGPYVNDGVGPNMAAPEAPEADEADDA